MILTQANPPHSRWRYGCGKPVTIAIPHGWDYKTVDRPCGSTGLKGAVVQCDICAANPALTPPPTPEYGDDI